MPKGTVKKFFTKKGYGFIESEDVDEEVFVHYSDIEGEGYKTLNEGEEVEFEIIESEKGLKAVFVNRLEGDEE